MPTTNTKDKILMMDNTIMAMTLKLYRSKVPLRISK
jgi:hypothetical protein